MMIVEEVATQILTRAYEKIQPIIMDLAEKYRLEKDQISLVGVGGGAASLIGFCSDKMGLRYSIPENAEVISSIGVASRAKICSPSFLSMLTVQLKRSPIICISSCRGSYFPIGRGYS